MAAVSSFGIGEEGEGSTVELAAAITLVMGSAVAPNVDVGDGAGDRIGGSASSD